MIFSLNDFMSVEDEASLGSSCLLRENDLYGNVQRDFYV